MNGSIEITEGTGIANLTDAGSLAVKDDIDLSYVADAGAVAAADDLDGIDDGSIYKKTTTNEKTGASRAYSGLDTNNSLITKVLPGAAIGTPAGAGLYLGSDKLGYYSGGWKTYMDNAGQFYLCGASGGWRGMASLTVAAQFVRYLARLTALFALPPVLSLGQFCSCAGNIGGWTLANGCLAATNAIMYAGAANTARSSLAPTALPEVSTRQMPAPIFCFWGGNTRMSNRCTV